MANETKIFTYALFEAIGFGTGGAIAGSLGLFNPENPVFPLFWAIMGDAGGASLGVASGSWKKVGLFACDEVSSHYLMNASVVGLSAFLIIRSSRNPFAKGQQV